MSQGGQGSGMRSSLPPQQPTYQPYGGDAPAISDPPGAFGFPRTYTDGSTNSGFHPYTPPRMMDGGGMGFGGVNGFGEGNTGGSFNDGSMAGGQYGNMAALGRRMGQPQGTIDPATGRPYGMQTLQGNAFNPAANQWGDYQQQEGNGLWGTDAQGINRVNGHVFAPSGLNSGNNDFSNWLNRFAPQFAQQNGGINRGAAQTWGAPAQQPGAAPGWTPGSGLGAGPGPQPPPDQGQIDPRTGRPYGMKTF